MARPSPVLRRSFPERVALGHLWSVVADISLATGRWGLSVARARVRARLGR